MGSSKFEFSKHYPHAAFHSDRYDRSQHRILYINNKLALWSQKLEINRNQRLIAGILLASCALWLISTEKPLIPGMSFLLLCLPFFYLVAKTQNIFRFVNNLKLYKSFYEQQIQKLIGLPNEANTKSPPKEFHDDLNIFGSRSLFSLINETFSTEASELLKQRLAFGLNDKKEILFSQKSILDLAKSPESCQRLLILGKGDNNEISLKQLSEIFETPLIDNNFKRMAFLHLILFPGYLIAFFMIGLGKLEAPLGLPIFVYALFSLISLKSVLASFRQGEILERTLGQLVPVFSFTERRPYIFSKELPTLENSKFSTSLNEIKFYVSFLSLQSHALAYLIVNSLVPWSFIFSGLAERWRLKNKDVFLNLLEEMQQLEIKASLTLFYVNQTQTFPQISDSMDFHAEGVYHPLIEREHIVANDIKLNDSQNIVLLTGSNMSGKSTFMRTLAVNQVLALAGAPIFAQSLKTTFAPVLSCMQVKDSLEQGYSYFYAEVRKVKSILNHVKSGKNAFFFIDEIFKGTNNKERLLGSQAVIQDLSLSASARGIVSTHDLELSQLAEQSESLVNYHFRDDVAQGELIFSYQLQKGPCPTTNALKIMKNEGLPVSI